MNRNIKPSLRRESARTPKNRNFFPAFNPVKALKLRGLGVRAAFAEGWLDDLLLSGDAVPPLDLELAPVVLQPAVRAARDPGLLVAAVARLRPEGDVRVRSVGAELHPALGVRLRVRLRHRRDTSGAHVCEDTAGRRFSLNRDASMHESRKTPDLGHIDDLKNGPQLDVVAHGRVLW